jgi:hypothetical protein
MNYSIRDIQARLNALGYDAGVVDGLDGPNTQRAIRKAMRDKTERDKKITEIDDLFDPSGLHRIHIHWTAGAYGDIALERKHYHTIVLEDGRVVYGTHKPEANANIRDGRYAAHTRACNTGAIGIACDAMGGAKESPFDPGQYPLTWKQLRGLAIEVANLCDTYDIPVSRYSVLTHAEVEPTLGVKQRWKWDITWLPDMSRPGDPIEVGDLIRDMVREEL